MKKLLIKQTDLGVALCDEEGEPLPGQISLILCSEPGDIVTATVVFAVGDEVVLAERRPRTGISVDMRDGEGVADLMHRIGGRVQK